MSAVSFDHQGDGAQAVKAYAAAARAGHCDAAIRLIEIYERGILGVGRDYSESLKWLHLARAVGCSVPPGR